MDPLARIVARKVTQVLVDFVQSVVGGRMIAKTCRIARPGIAKASVECRRQDHVGCAQVVALDAACMRGFATAALVE